MAKYECAKCGLIADSKCAASRSVYVEKELDAMFSHYFHGKAEERRVTASFAQFKDESVRDAFTQLRDHLTRVLDAGDGELDPPTLEEWLCIHEWRLQSDKCELGCCEKE